MVPFTSGKALTILPLETKNSVLDGKPTSCIFLFCLFYVYESVMPSILLLCQIPNAFSHVFQSNGHLTWAFHKRTKTFGHWVNQLKTSLWLQLHCPNRFLWKMWPKKETNYSWVFSAPLNYKRIQGIGNSKLIWLRYYVKMRELIIKASEIFL